MYLGRWMKDENPRVRCIVEQVALALGEMEQRQDELLRAWHGAEAAWALEWRELWMAVQSRGKRIRPRLLLLALGLWGGQYDPAARDVGMALELYHGFTLMYDDIQDNARTRRGAPAHHTTHGVSATMSLCVILEHHVNRMLLESSALDRAACLELIGRLNATQLDMGVGQMAETVWVRDGVLDIAEDLYWHMVAAKTGALFAFAAEAGAFLAGTSAEHQGESRDFGLKLGMLFQLVDDYADIFLADTDGKPRQQDIREAKRTFFLLAARRELPMAERGELDRLFRLARRTEADVAWLAARMATSGIQAEGRRVIQRMAGEVVADLERLTTRAIGEAGANQKATRKKYAVALQRLVAEICRESG